MSPTPPTVPPAPQPPVDAVVGSVLAERLPSAAVARLMSIAGAATFAAGERVLLEGAPTPFLAAVSSGRVALRLHVAGRGLQTLFTIEPGELLGWSAVVAPYRSTAEAVALERTELVTFDASTLRSLLGADRALAADVLPLVLETVSERLTMSWHQLLDLFAGEAREPW
jgi:CRP-like cAMP-binding protein